MALLAAAPEPMNATTNHSKIRVGITLPGENVLAGRYVTGKMEVECKSDKLGIGIIMVELFAFQELTSRDHSARMTFLHSRRLFQGPNLPPSNAVYAYPIPGDTDTPTLPEDYYKAKRGISTFLFRIPLPLSSPASINFANGLARVRYEVRGSVGVFWKGEKQLVMDKDEVGVLESYSEDLFGFGVGSRVRAEEGVVVVGENGRFWMHARIVGGLIVAGESACVELQVKNHSSRKNSGLVVALNRNLVLPSPNAKPSPLQISDTILTVPFKGQEYILPPGGEGVAHLVFDVPLSARSVRGGEYEGDGDEEGRKSDALFSIQASVEVKVVMGLGSKDIVVEIPVTIVHPSALPELPPQPRTSEPMQVYPQYTSIPAAPHSEQQYIDPNTQQIWIPPPDPYHNQYYQQPAYYSPQAVHSPPQPPLIYPQHQHQNAYTHLNLNLAPTAPRQLPARPSSAGPSMTVSPGHGAGSQNAVYGSPISGLPSVSSGEVHARLLPLPGLHATQTPPRTHPTYSPAPALLPNATQSPVSPTPNHNRYKTSPGQGEPSPSQAIQGDREEGKGVVASRISKHLRQSSVQQGRGRSVSPLAHRFGYPASSTIVGGGVGAAVIGVDGLLAVGSGDAPNDAGGDRGAGGDPILHSPRPQIRHKQSFTSGLGVVANRTGGNGKEVVMMMVRSESVVELEKIAAGLSEDNNDDNKDGVVKPHISISTSTDALDVVVDVNKTLPPPPVATKPRQRGSPGNAAALESLFDSPSPSPLLLSSPSQDLGTRDILPPTPTLMAVKRPSKLAVPVNSGTGSASASASASGTGTGGGRGRGTKVGRGGGGVSIGRRGRGGGGESGLDALERRLQAQVGTRKPEKEKKLDVRNILNVNSNSNTRPKLQSLTLPTTAAAAVAAGPDEVLREGNRTPTYTNVDSSLPPSTSSTPNPEGGKLRNGTTGAGTGTGSLSSERMTMLPDESAISSLTLDRGGSSVGGGDEVNYKEEEGVGGEGKDGREREEREYGEEMEMESVDGGKTHRAGKSVVGVESYVQSRNHQLLPPQQQYGQHKRISAIINSPSPSRSYPSSSQRPPTTTTTTTTPKKHTSPSTSTTSNAVKSKKSTQTRGRVTAWLGKIDPDAPPPQEQIIPPSPSVVKAVDWEEIMFGGGDEGEESDFVPISDPVVRGGGVKELEREKGKGKERNKSRIRTNAARPRSRSRSRSRSPPPFQPPELVSSSPPAQTLPRPTRIRTISQTVSPPTPSPVATAGGGRTAASPNPRSSGFMPIETMKAQRDTITQTMSRSVLRRAAAGGGAGVGVGGAGVGGAGAGAGAGGARSIGREASVVKEARRVMDIWSEDLPSSSSSPTTQQKQQEVEESELPSMRLVKPRAGVVDSPTPVTKLTNVNGNANKEDKEGEKGKKNVNANVKKYPFMVPSPPKTQSIRTDRRVSPPSVATISGGGGAAAAKRSIPQVIEPRSIPTSAPLAPPAPASSTTTAPTVPSPNVNKLTNQRLTPSPISYANVAASRASASPTSTSAAAAQLMKEKKLLNQNQRSQLPPPPQKLPVFPAPPPPASQQQQRQGQQEGNKYDVKSARGGKGGQVTHVASLWASVAAGNAGGGGGGGKAKVGAGAGTGMKKDVEGVGMTSTANPFKGEEIKKNQQPVVCGRPSLYPPPKSNSTAPATTGSNVDNDDVKMKKLVNGPPLLLPKKPSFTTVVASSPSTSPGETMAERIRLRSKTPTPSSSSKPGKPPTIPTPTTKPKVSLVPSSTTTTAKKSTPPSTSTSKPISKSPTPPSTTNNRPDKPKGTPPSLPTINAMAKPTSVPALVSSSLATPTLSSTASLVRPVGRSGSRTATVPVGMPGIGKGDYKSAVVGGGREGGSGEGGVNGVKVGGGAVRKRPTGLGVAGEEHGAQAQAPMKSKVVSPGQGMVSAPIAAVGLPKPNAVGAAASSTPAEGMDNVKRDPSREMAFGQARLRDLIKKYQGGDA